MAKTLGEFEQMILFALLDLEGEEAYGVTIREVMEERTRRSISSGAVYTALDRLREQGLVASWIGEPTPERGGRRKRLYRLEVAGLQALDRSARLFEDMSQGLLPTLRARLAEGSGAGPGAAP
jgi:DNA-binding PadR family transcriptional regulator